jgi:hypothetical protein
MPDSIRLGARFAIEQVLFGRCSASSRRGES